MTNKFFRCHCSGEGITIDAWDKDFLCLAMWSAYGQDLATLSLFDRIKWAWTILRKGKVYADAVLLDKKTAIEFVNEILNHTKNMDDQVGG